MLKETTVRFSLQENIIILPIQVFPKLICLFPKSNVPYTQERNTMNESHSKQFCIKNT
jgi:hypothetical protein